MMARALWAIGLVAAAWIGQAVAVAARADVTGDWALSYMTGDGVPMESMISIKKDGEKLTGMISSARGSIALNEIEVKGDAVTFAIVRVGFGDTIRIEYSGKVVGDTMTLKIKFGARLPLDATAKKKAGPGPSAG